MRERFGTLLVALIVAIGHLGMAQAASENWVEDVRDWFVDVLPLGPGAGLDTSIDFGPSADVVDEDGDVSFGFSSTLSPATFECQMDAEPYAACTSPKDYLGLSDGTHTFRVRATVAGVTDLSPSQSTFSVDTTPVVYPAVQGTPAITDDTTADTALRGCSPDGITSGDWLIALVQTPDTNALSWTDLNGWTAVGGLRVDNGGQLRILTKKATSTDIANAGVANYYTWTSSISTQSLSVVFRVSGADGAYAIDDTNSATSTTVGGPWTTPIANSSGDGRLLIHVVGSTPGASGQSYSWGTGPIEFVDVAGGTNKALSAAWGTQEAGPTTGRSATPLIATDNAATTHVIVIKPSA